MEILQGLRNYIQLAFGNVKNIRCFSNKENLQLIIRAQDYPLQKELKIGSPRSYYRPLIMLT